LIARSRRLSTFARVIALGLALCLWARAVNAQEPTPAPPLEVPPAAEPPAPAPSDVPVEGAPAAGEALPRARPVAEPPAAGPQENATGSPAAIGRGSMVRLFAEANPLLWPLLACSVVALMFALERFIALRKERVIPKEFVNRFVERLSGGKLDKDRAAELCRANDSAVARVFSVVVGYWGQPAAVIRQAIGYDASGEVLELKRNIRVLNGTATLAPLLGLLGTVVGMIQSFDALGGRVGTAKGEALAQGISLALIATAIGLVIAVFSVVAYYYFLNRVDILIRELDTQARKVIELVSAEAVRPSAPIDRRPNFLHPGDSSRHESRAH